MVSWPKPQQFCCWAGSSTHVRRHRQIETERRHGESWFVMECQRMQSVTLCSWMPTSCPPQPHQAHVGKHNKGNRKWRGIWWLLASFPKRFPCPSYQARRSRKYKKRCCHGITSEASMCMSKFLIPYTQTTSLMSFASIFCNLQLCRHHLCRTCLVNRRRWPTQGWHSYSSNSRLDLGSAIVSGCHCRLDRWGVWRSTWYSGRDVCMWSPERRFQWRVVSTISVRNLARSLTMVRKVILDKFGKQICPIFSQGLWPLMTSLHWACSQKAYGWSSPWGAPNVTVTAMSQRHGYSSLPCAAALSDHNHQHQTLTSRRTDQNCKLGISSQQPWLDGLQSVVWEVRGCQCMWGERLSSRLMHVIECRPSSRQAYLHVTVKAFAPQSSMKDYFTESAHGVSVVLYKNHDICCQRR